MSNKGKRYRILALKRYCDKIATLQEQFSESRIPTFADSCREKCKSHRRRARRQARKFFIRHFVKPLVDRR